MKEGPAIHAALKAWSKESLSRAQLDVADSSPLFLLRLPECDPSVKWCPPEEAAEAVGAEEDVSITRSFAQRDLRLLLRFYCRKSRTQTTAHTAAAADF